ncbi:MULTISPECIES: hypothetical protein [Gammaproteobacteria]|uniref:Uncharacterized protein n=1 Tax=Vibrio scophthalmi TaxID=45658 RepID=A0A1E3WJV9_9VIBR|nr:MULTISPECIES: hypothetical protein [Gammaproteobacteria]ODS09797.1 hypothetical protein VSF3289_00028 [Vibrio scophthalmi]
MNDYLEELNIDVFRERLLEELEVFLDKNNTNGFIKDETIYYFVSSLVDYIYYEVKERKVKDEVFKDLKNLAEKYEFDVILKRKAKK